MFNSLVKFFKGNEEIPKVKTKRKRKYIAVNIAEETQARNREIVRNSIERSIQRKLEVKDNSGKVVHAMDYALSGSSSDSEFHFSDLPTIDASSQFAWFAAQGFIGHQACAILAQHWLIDKACTIPAEDAIRNGYEITVNDGTEVDDKILEDLKKKDKEYKIGEQMRDFVRFCKIFGIRVAMFKIESSDPKYYEKPFNIDGVTPGSYKGISQIDPYWLAPELMGDGVLDPSAIDFYEPTYWVVAGGDRIHKSHLIIIKNGEVADILKPTYFYGGVPLTQKIYERVYAAERTANEAPPLALTKRTMVLKTDIAQAIANQKDFESRILFMTQYRDNFGLMAIGSDDSLEQIDTNLADLDNIIMTQYQLVAAIACVPADKLIETVPKGFNATGEYEQKSYHESLESIQCHFLDPLIERHHQILIRSYICPKYGISPFSTSVEWEALNSVDAKEQSEINKSEADTDLVLVQTGAIDAQDVRKRIINNPASGYNGLSVDDVPEEPDYEMNAPEPDDNAKKD
jgi:phage-related protein (TIGR01555 family)